MAIEEITYEEFMNKIDEIEKRYLSRRCKGEGTGDLQKIPARSGRARS
jgi:hypothetical protein